MSNETNKLNLYQKMAKARKALKDKGFKMTGNNEFAKYTYFELEDIVPPILDIEAEVGIVSIPSFYADKAELTIYDCDSDQTIVVTSPMSTAELKGCHEVQNLGAVETYIRRYLYMAAYNIVETDVLNKTQGKPDAKEQELTLDEALNSVTQKGLRYGDMTENQLDFIISKNAEGSRTRLKAEMVKAHKFPPKTVDRNAITDDDKPF